MVKALKTFSGKYGLIRAGTTFNSEPEYFKRLQKNGLAVAADEQEKPGAPGPSKNRNIPAAPGNGGKGEPGAKGQTTPGSSGRPPDAGKGQKSASLRADLASRGKTSGKSASGVTSKSIKKTAAKTRVILDPAPPAGSDGE